MTTSKLEWKSIGPMRSPEMLLSYESFLLKLICSLGIPSRILQDPTDKDLQNPTMETSSEESAPEMRRLPLLENVPPPMTN